jgi:hypothetical protein
MLISVCPLGFSRILYFRLFTTVVLGAPRRLFTSDQGRTGRGAVPPPKEGVEARRQAGQSCGQRGFSRRWRVVRLAPPREWEG